MRSVNPTRGSAWQGGGCVLLARVLGESGDPVTQSTVSSVDWSAWRLDTMASVVSDENETVSECVFNSLQTDERWLDDEVGYNFALAIGTPVFDEAVRYRIEVWLTMTSGSPIPLVFEVTTEKTLA